MSRTLLKIVSQYDGFYTKPPLDHLKYQINQYDLVCFCNDGFEVWIGTDEKWHTFYKHKEFKKMIFWYLKTWAFKDLFGLRTWLYYKLLSKSIKLEKVK
jgi:hypothetical protein